VQQKVEDPSKAKNDTPTALPKPDMVEPIAAKKPEPKTVAKPEPKKPEPQLHGRTPTQGAEVKPGMARVQTNQAAAVPFGGLATSAGGPVGGAYTDVGDFCCPEYLSTMQRLIYGNWQAKQGQIATNKLKFTVQRDGTITDVIVEESAGPYLDLASRRAIEQTQRLPPLPSAFTPPRLIIHLSFEYKR
jgi:TonB family protein